MGNDKFYLRNRQEVEAFEQMLMNRLKAKDPLVFDGGKLPISLITSFEQSQDFKDKEFSRKYFEYIIDIQINYVLILLDLHDAGCIWNQNFPGNQQKCIFTTDSVDTFSALLDIHRHCNSFVFRYRALWDKIMGLLVLLFCPEKYKRFDNAKSRKKIFKALASESIPPINTEFLQHLENNLEKFDNTFRTFEAHGRGSLWRTSFLLGTMASNPLIQLVPFHNNLTEILFELGEVLSKQTASTIEP